MAGKRIVPSTCAVGMMKDLTTSFMEVTDANSTVGKLLAGIDHGK
jgi:hypothetical protein